MSKASRFSRPKFTLRRAKCMSAVGALLVVGIAGLGTTTASAASHGKTLPVLTWQFQNDPIGLDPALNGTAGSLSTTFEDYEPLIYLNYKGQLEPDLATAWQMGRGNRSISLTIRKGVKFTDGSSLTASAVANSLEYDKTAGGLEAVTEGGVISSIHVTGKYTLTINFTGPDPAAFNNLLDQNADFSAPIGPAGLANPASLATQSDGTGPFELTPAGVETNVQYTYVRNPHYWNPSAVHWSEVVLKIIGPLPTSIYAADVSHEVEVSTGQTATVAAAKAAGFKIVSAPFVNYGLVPFDRDGQIVPPFGSLKVRQAMNYAVNRPAITAALQYTPAGKFGAPQDEPLVKGMEGYDPKLANYYPYDPAKAKELLKEAGYPNGFSFTMLDFSGTDPNGLGAEALQANLAAVGITANIDLIASVAVFNNDVLSKQYPAEYFSVGPGYGTAFTAFGTGEFIAGSARDPFGNENYLANRYLLQGAANTNPVQQAALYQKANDIYVKQAWFVPLYTQDDIWYVAPNIENVQANSFNTNPDPFGPTAADGWYEKGYK